MTVHVHCHDEVPATCAAELAWLSRDEQKRAARFVFERDRCQFRLSRVVLRRYVANALGRTPESLQFSRSVHGKPGIEGVDPHELTFSLSHTSRAIAVALGRGAIGVDIERHDARPFPAEIFSSVFTVAEREFLDAVAKPWRNQCAFALWTRKEAVLKGDGRGLGVDPIRLELALGNAQDGNQVPVGCGRWEQVLDGRRWSGITRLIASSWVYSMVVEDNTVGGDGGECLLDATCAEGA